MAWSALLHGTLRECALTAATATLRDLARRPRPPAPEPGEESGIDCGAVFAFAVAAQAELGDDFADLAGDELAELGNTFATARLTPFLFGGVPELGFAFSQLGDPEAIAAVCTSCDEVLLAKVAIADWQREYDLIRGLVGLGVYALERSDDPVGRQLAIRILDHLEATAEPHPSGLTWHSRPELMADWQRAIAPAGYYNLGIAHGIPGVVALLARYVHQGVDGERARRLLDGALAWLRATVPARDIARFPAYITPDLVMTQPTRLAWCYGDLGVGIAWLWAARATGDRGILAEAIEIAVQSLRRDRADCGVIDAGVCHGAAGNAHLYNRFFQATGDERFAEAARRWIETALAMRVSGQGFGGFLSPHPQHDEPRPDPRLLTGAAGTALVLLAAATDDEPVWDRLLLADVPPR